VRGCLGSTTPPAAESLLSALVGDPLRAIARQLPGDDRFRFRLTCRTMRDHSEPMTAPISRASFLRTGPLVVYACDELPNFMRAKVAQMLALAATFGCVAVLDKLMYERGYAYAGSIHDHLQAACCAAASHGQLEALIWLTSAPAAHGAAPPARRPRPQVNSRRCGTRASMAARGTSKSALRLLEEGISRCCDMRTSMGARARRLPAGCIATMCCSICSTWHQDARRVGRAI
jgi:hypothetical protein